MRSKILFLFFLFGFLIPNANAQRFRAGVIGGLVGSDVDGFDFFDYDTDFHKGGFTFGGMVNAKISDKNSFQFEMVYIQKGTFTGKPDSANDYTYYRLGLDYIEVPVIFRHQMHLHVNTKATDRFSFEIGPTFGALVRVFQDGNYGNGSGSYNSGLFDNKAFKKTDIGLTAGVSFNFLKNFYFDVRYANSLIPVTTQNQVSNQFIVYTFNKGHNMVFNFTIRYLFGKQEVPD